MVETHREYKNIIILANFLEKQKMKRKTLSQMDAKILILIIFLPIVCFGQKSKYPKDTIYIEYDKKKHFKKVLNHPKLGKDLYFQGIGVFYNYEEKADTLCIKQLKDYTFLNLKEIRKKEIAWVDLTYAKSKYKPYTGGGLRNGAFQTYLIEVISKENL